MNLAKKYMKVEEGPQAAKTPYLANNMSEALCDSSKGAAKPYLDS